MKKTILLVDEDPAVRRMLVRVLEEEDYNVIPAGTAEEAVRLPGADVLHQNGTDLFERLTAENPLLPLILLTARPNQPLPSSTPRATSVMEKPLDLLKLLRAMDELLAAPEASRRSQLVAQAVESH
ncbi:MAG: hypothetical protein DME25_04235 [Verrucomicrobia bacterium]|nr:MAG: hypothetical protein DME25_04235 [Verrucomicrobiota bacterium]